jgi:hypothetical protein
LAKEFDQHPFENNYVNSEVYVCFGMHSVVHLQQFFQGRSHPRFGIYTESHKGLDKGHRIADVNGLGKTVEDALQSAYQNIRKLHCLHSYFRTDVGQTLWPIGAGF